MIDEGVGNLLSYRHKKFMFSSQFLHEICFNIFEREVYINSETIKQHFYCNNIAI